MSGMHCEVSRRRPGRTVLKGALTPPRLAAERARAVPLQWARRAAADGQRRGLGVQQVLHAVHPHVHLRPAGAPVTLPGLRGAYSVTLLTLRPCALMPCGSTDSAALWLPFYGTRTSIPLLVGRGLAGSMHSCMRAQWTVRWCPGCAVRPAVMQNTGCLPVPGTRPCIQCL